MIAIAAYILFVHEFLDEKKKQENNVLARCAILHWIPNECTAIANVFMLTYASAVRLQPIHIALWSISASFSVLFTHMGLIQSNQQQNTTIFFIDCMCNCAFVWYTNANPQKVSQKPFYNQLLFDSFYVHDVCANDRTHYGQAQSDI